MKTKPANIVADGRDRYYNAINHDAVRKRLHAQITLRYQDQLKHASIWRRWWIAMKVRCDTRAELKKICSPAALHLAAGAN
jgi:hypothetical protein